MHATADRVVHPCCYQTHLFTRVRGRRIESADVAKTLGPRSSPWLLYEETDLHRLDEDPVRVVSETLQLDVAGA
jgi:hypothetical protein